MILTDVCQIQLVGKILGNVHAIGALRPIFGHADHVVNDITIQIPVKGNHHGILKNHDCWAFGVDSGNTGIDMIGKYNLWIIIVEMLIHGAYHFTDRSQIRICVFNLSIKIDAQGIHRKISQVFHCIGVAQVAIQERLVIRLNLH